MAEPHMGEEEEESLEFKWGKKRGIGGKKKDVQFYGSFTYDGDEYALFDNVYLHIESEPEPYIGKIIKIWENRDKSKKVKVQWFFRPREIQKFTEGIEILDNELFFACGEGIGLTNVNPLEAVAGKCNVVCISKDDRNPQPSDEELQRAHFVFRRFFNVGEKKILDEIDDKIAGIEGVAWATKCS
ncbi:protein ANTI-SILENCING 1-like isoform X2 [Gastrolobium bilobum]|uniref:protein ANTI-SILENCING 1-like isoform X2 n=1 Tax=Gastrolobium bilobum TaxID=150636 RepID=UPI002AB0CFE5|nr:protein ANTI-SILENCING 1-like isoform X2 [Gastrolobium bilobum]